MNRTAVLIAILLVSGSCFLFYSICRGLTLEIPQLPFGIVPNLPLEYWSAMALILSGLVLYFISEEALCDLFNLFIGFLVYLLFFGYFPLAESNLRYFVSWEHTAMTEYIVNNGHTSAQIFYHSWPGFHIWYGMLKEMIGVDLYVLGRFSPIILNLIFFMFLYLIIRKVTNPKAALLGIIAFVIVDDRFYFTVQPVVLSIVLYSSAVYVGFFKQRDWQSELATTIILCTSVTVHPLNILWSLAPILTLILMLKVSKRARDLNQTYSIRSLLMQSSIVLMFWAGWNISAVQNAAPTIYESFHNVFSRLLNSFSGAVSHGAIIQYTPSYWYRGTPMACQYMSMAVIGLVLVLAAQGFFGVLFTIGFPQQGRRHTKLTFRRAISSKSQATEHWEVTMGMLISCILLGIFPVLTGISLSTSSIMWGWTDRALLFVWVPITVFVCYFFIRVSKRNSQRLFAVLLVLSILPSFLSIHWLEFLPAVHSWEASGISFLNANTVCYTTTINSPTTILTDSSTMPGLWNISRYKFVSEGDAALSGQEVAQVWSIFRGEASPTSISWDYFFKSRRMEMAFPVNYGYKANYEMDQTLPNSSSVNLIYSNDFVRIYYRNGTR